MDKAIKTVKCLMGHTHEVYQAHYDNPNRTRLRLLSTTADVIRPDDSDSLGCIHRENIIKDDTIGFQVVNSDGDCYEHESFEIIECPEKASNMLTKAICGDIIGSDQQESSWKLIQIAPDTIEDPSFV